MRRHAPLALVLALVAGLALADVFQQRRVGTTNTDATRTQAAFHSINFTAATTEALVVVTPVRDYVNGSTCTTNSCPVTASKRLRLVGVSVCTRNAGAAGQGVVVKVRVNPSGAAVATSPVVAICGAGTQLAIANVVNCTHCVIDQDTVNTEITGDDQLAISQIGTATAGNDVILYGFEY